MAYGIAEEPSHSIGPHLDSIEYPVWRELLVRVAADSGAPTDLINLLKSLPRSKYESKREVFRDLAEAARRFAMGLAPDDEDPTRDRRNIGRDHVEGAPPGKTRHP
jgi:hypothetical protein